MLGAGLVLLAVAAAPIWRPQDVAAKQRDLDARPLTATSQPPRPGSPIAGLAIPRLGERWVVVRSSGTWTGSRPATT